MGVKGRPADKVSLDQEVRRDRLGHTHGSSGDFRSDPVSGQQ